MIQSALGFLVGEEEGDTVESCSGGLLGKEVFGENIFTYKIPVVEISACDSAGFLKVVVDAVDKLVNDCPECNDDSEDSAESSGSFQALEKKLESLLQGTCSFLIFDRSLFFGQIKKSHSFFVPDITTDGVGGQPNVELVTKSDDIRSELEFEITLFWSFEDARDLQIDLDAIFDGLELDEDIQKFVKGILSFEGTAVTNVDGSLAFTLVRLERLFFMSVVHVPPTLMVFVFCSRRVLV
jgi:hypothetical protein